jgi:hypothetical protein
MRREQAVLDSLGVYDPWCIPQRMPRSRETWDAYSLQGVPGKWESVTAKLEAVSRRLRPALPFINDAVAIRVASC